MPTSTESEYIYRVRNTYIEIPQSTEMALRISVFHGNLSRKWLVFFRCFLGCNGNFSVKNTDFPTLEGREGRMRNSELEARLSACGMIDAAQRGDTAAIAAAMRTGNDEFDVNARDIQHGMTALLWACSCDEADVVKLLLMDPRVDRRALSKYEMAVLHHAAAANAMRVLPLLLDDDASFPVDGCNEWKETALHLAAAAGHRAAVGALLRAGASVDATDKWGRTPSFVAR